MPRVCTVCSHPERRKIDKRIAEGATNREIAGQYDLTDSSVDRHKAHIADKVARYAEKAEADTSRTVLQQVSELVAITRSILDDVQGDDKRTALQAIRELRGNIELLGKLTGELQSGASVQVTSNTLNVWDSKLPGIARVLQDFPDALEAVRAYLSAD